MTIGFIGAGNMAGAIINGILTKNVLSAGQLMVNDISLDRLKTLHEELGVVVSVDAHELVDRCDIVFLSVKPHVVMSILAEQRENLRDKAVICIAAGWNGAMLTAQLHAETRSLCVMPNTPALVGEGVTALSMTHTLNEEEKMLAEQIFGALGRYFWIEDRLLDASVGVHGSGPAYAYLFIEAMADGGVALGLPRKQAIEMAAQTLLGAAKMVLETGMHPGELKDMVTSPGGTTIAAVRSLENDGFRGAVMNAVIASAEKAASLKK